MIAIYVVLLFLHDGNLYCHNLFLRATVYKEL